MHLLMVAKKKNTIYFFPAKIQLLMVAKNNYPTLCYDALGRLSLTCSLTAWWSCVRLVTVLHNVAVSDYEY